MTQNKKTKTINAKLAQKHWDEYKFDEAFSFACKADPADPFMMRIMGYGYLHGNGTAVDEEKGRALLESAMGNGDVEAKAEIACLYRDGYAGYPQDYDRAEKLFREAAESGSAFAAGQLGCMYRDGLINGEADYVKAIECLKIGADDGDSDSIVNLAYCYYNGTGVVRNLEKAFELYQKAARGNDNIALNAMGWMCEHGEGTGVDVECALDCYQKAADFGNEQAAINLDSLKKGLGDTYRVLENARTGDVQAQYDLAYWYYNGENGLPLNYKAARKWYKVAADAGNVGAMQELGIMLWHGQGGEPDKKYAIELWRNSAEKGYLMSLNSLGRAYLDGEFRDYDKALKCLRESADKGLIWSMNDLGNIYQQGVVVEQDLKTAYDWYLKSAMAGDAAAQWAVARMNEIGEGVPVNLEDSEKWYLSAAGLGHADSKDAYLRVRRRRMLEEANAPNTSVEKKQVSAETLKENVRLTKEALAANDYITAFRYASNADSDDQDVQFVMGRCFHYGWGVDRNGEEAVNWLSKSAAAGNPEAQAELAGMYHYGDVVAQDYAKAYALYKQSASADCLEGIKGLGNLLLLGEGVGKNVSLAIKYYQMAADKGDVDSHLQLGYVYYSKHYGIINYEESFRHYLYAAEHGNAIAMFNLGVMYENGEGVEKNEDEAIDWYTKSAKAGNDKASAVLKQKSYSNKLFLADKRLNTPYKVFISYRRDGGREYARSLYLAFRGMGIKTFFDYSSLQHGDFNVDILRAIEEAPNFVMMVTDGAFERCVDENDWVRKEIEYARKLGKNIVPIAPTGHKKDLSRLPDSLADVRTRQVFRLDIEDNFDECVCKIVRICLKGV